MGTITVQKPNVLITLPRADVCKLIEVLKDARREAQKRILKARDFEDRSLAQMAEKAARADAVRVEEILDKVVEQFPPKRGPIIG